MFEEFRDFVGKLDRHRDHGDAGLAGEQSNVTNEGRQLHFIASLFLLSGVGPCWLASSPVFLDVCKISPVAKSCIGPSVGTSNNWHTDRVYCVSATR